MQVSSGDDVHRVKDVWTGDPGRTFTLQREGAANGSD